MQQMYSCPNCGTPVAYGQPYCRNCKTVFNWPVSQTQGQYQPPADQPAGGRQNYGATAGHQPARGGTEGSGGPPQKASDGPGLLQLIIDNRARIIKISVAVLIVACLAGAGIALHGEIARWFAAPVISSFEISPLTVTAGREATLRWNVSGASSVSISPEIGTVPAVGMRKVSPDKATTYTIFANNTFGSASRQVAIAVTGVLPSINNFSINPASIFTGQAASVSWGVADATSVAIEPGIGTVALSGTASVSPGSTTVYVLTASNGAGNSTSSATLNVTTSKAPIITTFSASPGSINSGDSSTLTWDVINAKSINISHGISGVAAKGSTQVTPAETITYTLTADSDYGSATRSVTVIVDTSGVTGRTNTAITKDPPAITSFSASHNSITLGDNVTLNWAVSGARSVSITPGVGTVPASGWTMVIPIATTTYELSAVNTFGTETANATVTVNKLTDGTAPVIRSFTASPSTIQAGGTSSLTWEIKGATLYIIDQGIGAPASKFSQPVSPPVTTDYTLTAINSYGTDRAIVTVTVNP